ncbi:hypothetical protein DFH06DRAFT_64413 [Mycena polygramma]|nr:hypothetical protein DFH06DRAFT_64413 [Mycena polygramma]
MWCPGIGGYRLSIRNPSQTPPSIKIVEAGCYIVSSAVKAESRGASRIRRVVYIDSKRQRLAPRSTASVYYVVRDLDAAAAGGLCDVMCRRSQGANYQSASMILGFRVRSVCFRSFCLPLRRSKYEILGSNWKIKDRILFPAAPEVLSRRFALMSINFWLLRFLFFRPKSLVPQSTMLGSQHWETNGRGTAIQLLRLCADTIAQAWKVAHGLVGFLTAVLSFGLYH